MKQKQHVIALAVLVLLATLAVAALVGCDKTVEITFDPGNGASPTTVTLTAGEVLTAPQDPVREGYTFLGWFLGGEKYTFGAVSENMTLEARWEIDTYTVTFDTAGGAANEGMFLRGPAVGLAARRVMRTGSPRCRSVPA